MDVVDVVEGPGVIYLASPYSDENPAVEECRYRAACRAAGRLMLQGRVVFSPIAHSHSIAVEAGLKRDFGAWREQNEVWLDACSELWVLTLPGWHRSKGVAGEVGWACGRGIPVRYVDPTADDLAAFDALNDETRAAALAEVP